MENVLLKTEEFDGCYVVLKSFTDKTVIANGDNPEELMKEAYDKGYQNAVIVYVTEKDMVSIY